MDINASPKTSYILVRSGREEGGRLDGRKDGSGKSSLIDG